MSHSSTGGHGSAASHQPLSKSRKYCLFCRMDITNLLYFHCASPQCHDVDMCAHCFKRGFAVYPHHPSHPYQVMDSISLAVFDQDWSADEELALLDAVDRCGFGNWSEIAAAVSRKTEAQCEQHYFMTYLLSPTAPLPDLSQPYPVSTCLYLMANPDPSIDIDKVLGDDPEFVQEIHRLHQQMSGGDYSMHDHDTYRASSSSSSATVLTDYPSSGGKSAGYRKGAGASTAAMAGANASGTSSGSGKTNRGYGGKGAGIRARLVGNNDDERHTRWKTQLQHFEKATELSRWKAQQFEFRTQQKNNLASVVGYLPQRYDLEVEYLNDAEKDIADMDFRADDTLIEKELKLRVLELYNNVLDERAERKEFIDRYQLLIKREKRLSKEEKEVYKSLRPFARYLEPEEFDEFIRCVVAERALRFRIEQLQTYRMNGIQTLADGLLFDQEHARVQRLWDLKYRKKYIEMSAIPVAQNTTVESALRQAEQQQQQTTQVLNEKLDQYKSTIPASMDGSDELAIKTEHGDHIQNQTMTGSAKPLFTANSMGDDQDDKSKTAQQQFQPSTSSQPQQPQQQRPLFSANSEASSSNATTTAKNPQQSLPDNQPKLCPCHPKVLGPCHFDLTTMPHYDQLSQSEQLLCIELHFTPAFYLTIKNKLIKECVSHGYVTKGVARSIIKIDVHCADRLLNFCVSNNIINEHTPQ